MSASANKTFKGYAVTDGNKWSDFSLVEYLGKTWEETDVEVAITHCGVCGSDVHTISSGWGPVQTPMVVGHEIVGTAVRVGSQVKGVKVGDRVGVGAMIGSCYKCKACKSGNENFCQTGYIYTYDMKYPDSVRTQGGYSTGIIANEQFVFPVPEGIASEDAASMMCGGLTVYSPLLRNGAGPGKKVGIVGIGGLGHYGVLFAKALGAEVYAFSRGTRKAEDAKKLGADHFVDTTQPNFAQPLLQELDLIVSAVDNVTGFHFEDYVTMLAPFGKFVSVAAPDDPLPGYRAMVLNNGGTFIGGSRVGSKNDAVSMLKLAAEKKVKPWIEVLPMKDVKKAVEGVWNGKARYRYVLEQDIEA